MKAAEVSRARVLLVDDDAAIREIVRTVLEEQGIRIEEAADGPEALRKLSAGATFDLIVLDLVLPGMSGQQVFWEMRKVGRVPVLFHSGFRGTEKLEAELREPETAFLQKPWSLEQLEQAVEAFLAPR